jgi:hypothetical protein
MAMIHMNLVQSMSPMYSRQTRKRLLPKKENENVFDMIMATRARSLVVRVKWMFPRIDPHLPICESFGVI